MLGTFPVVPKSICFYIPIFFAVNNGAQFDAVRAFLQEIDVGGTVWIGLTKADGTDQFKWTYVFSSTFSLTS